MKNLILLCALALPAALHAQTFKTWAGGAGNWSATNWNPGGTVPAAIDSASITNVSSSVTLDLNGFSTGSGASPAEGVGGSSWKLSTRQF